VSDEVYEQVRKFFSEKELADLTLAVVAINGWNRLNIAARTVPARISLQRRVNSREVRKQGEGDELVLGRSAQRNLATNGRAL
jgi:hypothetical protein